MVNIYDYIDYRQYLVALYEYLHATDGSVSYRSFSRLAGSTSPNFLQLIRDRKLNIAPRSVSLLANTLKLNKKEEEYFEAIISFDHAKTHKEKDRYLRHVLQMRNNTATVELQKEQFDFVSRWYIPVVRELLICKEYTDDPQWIADRIVPRISLTQVKKAITLLENLGMITRNAAGQPWRQTSRTVSTPSEVLSVAATSYHLDAIGLGRDAIERFTAASRDIRAVTIGLPHSKIPEIKQRIEGFWNELLSFANDQHLVEEVVQVNIQMFPMSDTRSSVHETA